MSPIRDDKRRELLILDSGPLRELVLHHAVFEFGLEQLRNDLRWLKNRASYAQCSEMIASFKRRTTSAAVVAELNYWIRATHERGRARLWNRVYEEYRGMDLREEMVPLVSMNIEIVTRFGPVDASLFELANRNRASRPVVLTVDSGLCGQCRKAGFSAHLLDEL